MQIIVIIPYSSEKVKCLYVFSAFPEFDRICALSMLY